MSEEKTMMILPLRGVVVFPNMTVNVEAVRKRAVSAIEEAMAGDSLVMLVARKMPALRNRRKTIFLKSVRLRASSK